MLLEQLTDTEDGQYKCHITAADGQTLFDDVVRSEVTSQTMKVLQKAIGPQISRNKGFAKRRYTISKSLGLGHDTKNLGFLQDDSIHILLCVRILVPDAQTLSSRLDVYRDELLAVCMPEMLSEVPQQWSPRDFYDNVHVPRSDEGTPNVPPIDQLQCTLYPFQKRAVQWLLGREKAIEIHKPSQEVAELPHGFARTNDAEGKPCFINQILGLVTTNESLPFGTGPDLKGGILAEEMGLGKTVEMIALICLHKKDLSKEYTLSEDLLQSSATLIITPPAILRQWKNELQTLAPSLNVLIYEGVRVEAGKTDDEEELLSRCMSNDVVLTTYNVLAKEIHYAETPDRNLRHEKKYEKRLSPLTQITWWRVVLDEAQNVESGVSNAAKVANLIPREIAWCVSGTPVKKDSRDLFGLLHFLRYRPYCDLQPKAWDHLVTHHKSIFQRIFRDLALRHTKEQIKDDIKLPPQKRVVITVPFTQIEEQHYSTMFKQMSDECGLNLDGAPVTDDWDPDSPAVIEKMRSWLTRLRQTCLHPEVGSRNRRALGNGKGPLRTVGEVLEVIIEQNDTTIRSEERTLFLSQIRRGQILEHAEQSEEALQIWLQTLEEVQPAVQELRDQLRAEIDRLSLIEDLEETATAIRTGPHRQRLRAAIEIEHTCNFFVANAYFQIKTDEALTKPESEQFQELERREEFMYENAKILRKELLLETRNKADSLMIKINEKVRCQSFVEIPNIEPLKNRGGIESRVYLEKLDELIAVMQDQAKQIVEWRKKTIQLLVLPLVDEEETDLQGDEYETSTKQQDEVYVYVDALRAMVSDRHDFLTGQKNLLIEHEMKFALAQSKEGGGHSPELLQQLLSIRDQLKPTENLGSVRAMVTQLRELKASLRGAVEKGNTRSAAELLMVNDALDRLHRMLVEQTKPVTGLDREIELFKDTMNSRLEYYRQLQQISDTVAAYEEQLDDEARNVALLDKRASEYHLKARIATLKAKGRYLVHLRDEATNVETQRLCIICQTNFEVGILTSCGHSYCIDCLRLWWGTHRNCPTCKKHLSRNDFHQITYVFCIGNWKNAMYLPLRRYKPQELSMQEEIQSDKKDVSIVKDTEESAIYSGIHDTILNQIKNIDLDGSFGTKIDTLARHMLWIREHDPGAKSIVFSQYRDFLDVLAKAFGQFKIGFTGIDRKDGIQKFKNDPSVRLHLSILFEIELTLFGRWNASFSTQRHILLGSIWSMLLTSSFANR